MDKPIPESVVEAVARAICVACEENPDHRGDARGNEFRWQDYRDTALAAINALTAAQQPAAAQQQDGGRCSHEAWEEDGGWCTCVDCGHGWSARTAHPSAPVGVEDVVMAARNAENAIRNCAAAGQIGEGYVQYADDLRDAVQRLAQQPAAGAEALSHADLCRLSRVFNAHNVPGLDQDRRINEWLGKRIAAALATQQQGGRADG